MNDEQIAYWNGVAGERWTQQQTALDRALAAFGRAVLERAAARPSEHVLDVGCGCGDSALALADSVGAQGSVVGVDVSAQMLSRARERAGARSNLSFVLGDAAATHFPHAFQLIFSRFGVMFFEDPVAAFRNLHEAAAPGGRLVFACWRAFEDNPWVLVPLGAVRSILPDLQPPPTSGSPGPFAFADRANVESILDAAGFRGVTCERFEADVVLSTSALEDAVEFVVSSGPVARLLQSATAEQKALGRAEVKRVLAPRHNSSGLTLPGSIWIVTGHA